MLRVGMPSSTLCVLSDLLAAENLSERGTARTPFPRGAWERLVQVASKQIVNANSTVLGLRQRQDRRDKESDSVVSMTVDNQFQQVRASRSSRHTIRQSGFAWPTNRPHQKCIPRNMSSSTAGIFFSLENQLYPTTSVGE